MNDPTDKVFKRVEGTDPSLDMREFNVLMAMDGVRTLGAIAREDHYELQELAEIVDQLAGLGLVASVQASVPGMSKDVFFEEMEKQVSQFMGPVGNIVIQDSVADLGSDMASFPMSKAIELVHQVARSIPNRNEANDFINGMQAMLAK